jgi:hypothetical protein
VRDIRKKYNRRYYWKMFKIQCDMRWKLFKVQVVTALLYLAYKVDYDLMVKITGREWSKLKRV